MAKPKGRPENMRPPTTKEEARRRGHNGGVKSGEVRRNKKNARETMRMMLQLAAKGKIDETLENLGVDKTDRTNFAAMCGKAFTEYMRTGDIRQLETVIKIAGYDASENRKYRESEARIRAMDKSGIPIAGEVDASNRNDVLIMLPDDGRGNPGGTAVLESQAEAIVDKMNTGEVP